VIATVRGGLQRLRAGSGAMPSLPPAFLKSLVPLMVIAVAITALVLMYLWQDQASYKPVFGARQKVATADMMSVLDAEGIPYRLHPESGQVLVPDAQLGRVRMLLAAKGVAAQLPAGLELMDQNDPLGVSQFVQDVRYRRGLEGELAQSILTLDAVDSVRVHLSIARSTSFVATDGEKSTASVVLGLKPGRTLSPEQIAAIINLVAGSVSTLDPQRVSLVDQAGNYLSARVDLSDGFETHGGNEAAHRFQNEARGNVRDLLSPVLGEHNYRVSVTAEVDNDRVEETHEKYGEAPRVTSEATREEQDRNRVALGVPGSLSNRPVAAPAAHTPALRLRHDAQQLWCRQAFAVARQEKLSGCGFAPQARHDQINQIVDGDQRAAVIHRSQRQRQRQTAGRPAHQSRKVPGRSRTIDQWRPDSDPLHAGPRSDLAQHLFGFELGPCIWPFGRWRIVFRERMVGTRAIDADRTDEHEATHSGCRRLLREASSAFDICQAKGGARRFIVGRFDVNVGGRVHDDIGTGQHRRPVSIWTQGGAKHCIRHALARCAHDCTHRQPVGAQAADERATDETAGTGYHDRTA